MHGMMAMAGLAEAAEARGLVIYSGALFGGAMALGLAWWKSSPVAALVAFAIFFFVGAMVEPWRTLESVPSNDPDEAYWLFRWRVFALFWIALSIAGTAYIYGSIRRLKLNSKSPEVSEDL